MLGRLPRLLSSPVEKQVSEMSSTAETGRDAVAVHAQAERDAQHLLERLEMTEVPVDPITVARALGVRVWTSDLEPNVAGVLLKRRGEAPEIYVSAHDHINRQRFTIAHEVGHLIERAAKGNAEVPGSFVDYRDDVSSQGSSPAEMYANGFAAALLMPAGRVRELWDQYRDVDSLARQFKVSTEAMRHRLRNLGVQ
jgi:Zn-dependent peptidase ImmA (M78 family)